MPKTIDPLLLLKQHIQSNQKIEKQGQYLIFPDNIKLKLDTPTACRHSQTNKHYTMGSLWLYLKHRLDPLAVYIRESQKERIDVVTGQDKDQITDFFINDISDVKIIDQDIRPKTLIFLGKKSQKGENLEKMLEDEYKSSKNNESKNNIDNNNINNSNTSLDKKSHKKQKQEELEPNLKIMEFIYNREKKSLNRNSVMRPMTNLFSFENLLSVCKKTFLKSSKGNKVSETISFLDELISGDDLRGNKAIIIVPSSYYPGNLSIQNAEKFLLDAVYINPENEEDRKNLNLNSLRSNVFTKKIKGKELNFEIQSTSNVRSFSKSDWKRVVAVFVQGFDWEFSDWPKNETITSILLTVKGFNLKYSDLPANENVKKWNVKKLEISRFKRHFDVSVQNEFWTIIEEFLNQPRFREKNQSNNINNKMIYG